MTQGGTFKRMIINLPQSPSDYAGVRTVAELSKLIGVDLVATFLEDPELIGLSALRCVRELRTAERAWRSLDAEQLARDLERAAVAARQQLAEAAQASNIHASFQLVRGTAEDVALQVQPGDIVALIEPRHPVERITRQFTSFAESAFKAASSVMVIPSRVGRRRGPIVSIAAGAADPTIAAGSAIARAMNERLVVLNRAGRRVSTQHAGADPQAGQAGAGEWPPEPIQAQTLFAALADLKERLLVIPRGGLDWPSARMIASLRGIPILATDLQEAAA